jgi:hypothetical protein
LGLDNKPLLCYNKGTKREEIKAMMRYTVQHKHCGKITTIEGYTVWDAFRSFGLDPKVWEIIWAEEI